MLAFLEIWVIQALSFTDFYTILVEKFIRCQIGTSLAEKMLFADEKWLMLGEQSPVVRVLDIARLFI